MRLWLGVLLLVGACQGTEGTLLVLHDEGDAGAAGSSEIPAKPFVPASEVNWDARLDGAIDISRPAQLFYLDAELQPEKDLVALHAAGRHYFCYLSAGTFEEWRSDAADFPESVLGNDAPFRNERWLDVRAEAVRSIMAKRVESLAAKGCDGVPPSSLAVHVAESGFPLTLSDALDYARWLAERIHGAGMSAGLSGPEELTTELWPSFDFGLAIDCLARTQCAEFGVFERAGRPVLHLEFGDEQTAPALCSSAKGLGFTLLISTSTFDGQTVRCQDIL